MHNIKGWEVYIRVHCVQDVQINVTNERRPTNRLSSLLAIQRKVAKVQAVHNVVSRQTIVNFIFSS